MVTYVEVYGDGARGLGRIRKAMTGYARRIPKMGRRGIWLSANRLSKAIRLEAAERGHVTTGFLASEKGTHPIKIDKDTWGIKMPYYTKYLETGTTPHFIPRMYKTMLWAKKHGMSFETMRHIIATRGTRSYPFIASVIAKEAANLKNDVDKQVRSAIKKVAG